MSPEDRKTFWGIIVGVAWGGLTMAGPLAFPKADPIVWKISFGISAIVVMAGVLILTYDFFIRPRLKGARLDPFLATAMAASIIAAISIAIYAIRSTPSGSEASGTNPNSAEPQIVLVAPEKRHQIVWNPKKSYAILYAPEGEINESRWTSPIFYLKNLNSTAAQDATVTWQIEMSGIETLVKSSPRLSKFKFDFADKQLVIGGGAPGTFTYREWDIRPTQDTAVNFISYGKGTQAFIPTNVFINALLYTLALMPDQAGARLDPFTFSLSVSWNLPKPGKQNFLVKATIVNAKPPGISEAEIDALMSFEVAKIQ